MIVRMTSLVVCFLWCLYNYLLHKILLLKACFVHWCLQRSFPTTSPYPKCNTGLSIKLLKAKQFSLCIWVKSFTTLMEKQHTDYNSSWSLKLLFAYAWTIKDSAAHQRTRAFWAIQVQERVHIQCRNTMQCILYIYKKTEKLTRSVNAPLDFCCSKV